MTGRLAGRVAFITGAAPEDIPDAVLWPASDESRNITAAGTSVDQGCTQY
jgi:NAD(P)-dependent dehydrogenase (short-subunit alcohol dehydrogenase family)